MRLGPDLALFQALEEGVVAVDGNATVVFFNASAERMFGYLATEIRGQALDKLIPEAARTTHRSHVEQFKRSGTTGRMMGARSGIQGLRRDGTVFEAEASISKCVAGDETVMVAIIRDVTRRKAAEALLQESELKHRAILETCADAVLLADAETGLILEANDRAGELFGCEASELVGRHQTELHPDADRERLRRTFREHVEAGRILVPDAAILRRDGSVVPVEITARPTRIGGRLVVVGFFRDIRHRKARERRLIEAQEAAAEANRAKTTFLANVSHELRTPLNAVIALSEMIGSEIFGPAGHPKYVEYARDIRESGQHLLELINDILDLSRVELGKVVLHEEEIDLADTIDQCWRAVRQLVEESGLTCERRIGRGAHRLVADGRAVRQMLLNLLSNAIKHTPRGGRIEVVAEVTAGGGLALIVADNGVGITLERLATVTTPFNSANARAANSPGGTGLGLAITKGLLERHGGALEIESRPGKGTAVRLLFPPARVPATPLHPAA